MHHRISNIICSRSNVSLLNMIRIVCVADSQDLKKWGLEELKGVIMEFQDHQFAQAMILEEQMMQGMTR